MTEKKFNETLIQLDDTFKRNYGVGFMPIDQTTQPIEYNGYIIPGSSSVSYGGYQIPN
jgi:hypothetical protein